MKKIFLLLLTLISVNVQAENKYTDFEFKELVEEKQNDDEFNKYESTTFNKFYKLIEVDTAYIEGLETNNYAYVDPTDYQIDENLQQTEIIGPPHNGFITINCEENYLTNQLILKKMQNFENTISKLEVYHDDTLIDANIEIDTNTDMVNIYLDNDYYLNELKLMFHYSTEEDYRFEFTFVNKSDKSVEIIEHLTLSFGPNKVTLNALNEQDYIAFTQKNNFSSRDILYYYSYPVTRYKHYNIQKEYYIDSEDEEIEGYMFDPTESYTMYKHYTRKLLEPTPPIENIPTVEEKPKEENIGTEKAPEKQQAPTKEEPKKIYTNVSSKKYNSSNKVDATPKDENNTYPAVVDTTKNEQSITNLENKKDNETKNDSETEEPKCKIKTATITVLLSICMVLLLINAIFSGIDLIKSVNKRR